MEHLTIWLEILIFIVGVISAHLIYQNYKKSGYSYLKSLFWAVILFNVLLIKNSFSLYLQFNIFSDPNIYYSSVFKIVNAPLSGLLFLSTCLAFVFYVFHALDKNKLLLVRYYSLLIFAAYITLFLSDYYLTGNSFVQKYFILLSFFLIIMAIIITCFYLVKLILSYHKCIEKPDRKVFTIFGRLYVLWYFAIIITMLIPELQNNFTDLILFLSFNVFSFIWIKFIYERNFISISSNINRGKLGRFTEIYELSSRQLEIAELIIMGKNNREIAAKLFIAQHTVKNHIYNLYKKIGIKNRYELIKIYHEIEK